MNFQSNVDPLKNLRPHGAGKAGECAAMYRKDSNELALKYVENKAEGHSIYNLSNYFRPVISKRASANMTFGYDHYGKMFPQCDVCNNNLCGHTHLHRTGSGKHPGEEGKEDNSDIHFNRLAFTRNLGEQGLKSVLTDRKLVIFFQV